MVEPSRDVATFLELAGRFGSLTGYGNDQSRVPLLVALKPCCRKSLPTSFDSMNPLRSAPFAAATPELPLPKDEKDHAGVPSPVIACIVKRAPLRVQAPHTLFASIETPSAMAVASLYCQTVLPEGPNTRLSGRVTAIDGAFELRMSVLWIMPCGVAVMNARRVTPAARTAWPRVVAFAAAKRATKASAATENNPAKMRRLKNPPSPTSLRARPRRIERLWRPGADTEFLRVLAT